MVMTMRVNIVSAVNSAKISKSNGMYTIRDVVPIVDEIVMNGLLYQGSEIDKAYPSLNNTPAPAGHPKNTDGQYVSAANATAMQQYWVGAAVTNARKEGDAVLVDITVNEAQAQAMDNGKRLIERLDAAMAGNAGEPIHVSTGVLLRKTAAKGESKGKAYNAVASDMVFDHLAILLDEQGAGTPDEGVGMWLNHEGESEPVFMVNLEVKDVKKRKPITANSDELSFSDIAMKLGEALSAAMPQQDAWVVDIFDKYFVYRLGDSFYKSDYYIDSENVVSLIGDPQQVERKTEYDTIHNREESSQMKDAIIAALNAAGISHEGRSDADVLAAYNALQRKELEQQVNTLTEKIVSMEANEAKRIEGEKKAIADKLAVNSALTADDLMALPLQRLQELSAVNAAAPVVVGNASQQPQSEFAGYDLNNPFGSK